MAFTSQDIHANRDYFVAKLKAERQMNDVARWSEGKPGSADFLLLDVRGRDAFAKAHIQGALCVPPDELDTIAGKLPKDKELVTYCWNGT